MEGTKIPQKKSKVVEKEEMQSESDMKNQQKRVLDELTKKGHILEIQVVERLDERNWLTKTSEIYTDFSHPIYNPWKVYGQIQQEGIGDRKTREIDVVAMGFPGRVPQFSGFTIELVIECKKREKHNWAFLCKSSPEEQSEYYASIGGQAEAHGAFCYFTSGYNLLEDSEFSSLARSILDHNPIELQMLINGTSHHSYIHLKKKATKGYTLFSNKDEDSLYDACCQVIGASIFRNAYREYDLYANNRANPTYYWRIYPVIVFDGPIWEIERVEGETLVSHADWVTYDFQWNAKSHYIDIVCWKSFEKYSDMIEEELKRFRNANFQPKEKHHD